MSRPVIVYDDECGFCKWCVKQMLKRGEFDAVGFDDLPGDKPLRLPDGYEDCVHLVTEDEVYSCGAAVEEVFVHTQSPANVALRLARGVPGYRRVRDVSYGFVADHRHWFGRFRSCDDLSGES